MKRGHVQLVMMRCRYTHTHTQGIGCMVLVASHYTHRSIDDGPPGRSLRLI